MLYRHDFPSQLTALQADQSVGKGIVLFLLDILADDFQQVSQRHDGPAYHEVEQLLFFLRTAMTGSDVLQADGIGYFSSHLHFLADTVYQMEMCFRKENSQRNSRKPPPVPKSITVVSGRNCMTLAMPSECST